MTINRTKLIVAATFAAAVIGITIGNAPAKATAVAVVDDPAATFKTKCAACHSPKAEKFYNPEAPIDEQVQAILKGKKGEKPPYMPEFGSKGITEDDAKALANYMKSLRAPAN